ncbi:MAG: chromosome segregation protein SMC [Desulfobacteraceae bacterium]|jgi:chromosome segregation protein|nr:chromosome segregation protein SMC [Desulfobacteraceae bacterium]
MKLKKLEITGFKSFYEKATIKFPPGISAVVGPNGCGKSNILDALRWVMGEQSLKQLRGKSIEDIIFSGTNGKSPLNMAEVSLTLANDNGTGPEELKDFTEINLTRRLYRSGETGYFLNRQPCRLKDIHNIFLGSGLGSKSYAVIQQGNIGAITEATPEERRYYIEEAAGTTRYKSRKTEALRKVDITRQNLLRVNDILSEIQRQMASLKRQARKAELYNNLQKRIKILDVHLGIHNFEDLCDQIEQTDSLIRELKDADIGHSSELKKLDAAIEEIKLKRWQKNQEISERKSEKYETQRIVDRSENDLAHLRTDIQRLAQETSELTEAREDLVQKNQDMVSEISEVEADNVRLRSEIEGIRENLTLKRQSSEEINQKLAQLNQELDSRKTQLMNLMTQEAQYKNIYQNAASSKESLQRRLKRADEEEVLAQNQIKIFQTKESRTREELETLKAQIEELTGRITATRNLLDQKSSGLAQQVKRVQTLELERNTAKSKYNTLKKMEDNFEWYRDGVRAIMKAPNDAGGGQASELPGISRDLAGNVLELMADIIEADPAYETAIEAVLGESLQYIIVKDQETSIQAIDYLQQHSAGRSGFIPIASVKPIASVGSNPPPSAGLLLNHINVKAGYEKIAQAILGDVILTETIDEAIALFNKNGTFQRIVTKNGDVISHQGILVGGSKDKLSGILAKKNEIKELKRQDGILAQKIDKSRIEQHDMESEVQGLEINLQKQIEQKNRITEDEIEAEKALYKAGEDLKNAHRHLEIVQLEQEQLLGEASDIDDEMTKYNSALSKVSADINTAQNTVAELSEKIGTVSSEMEEFNQSVIDLKLKLTALNARLENSDSSLKRLKEFHQDGRTRLEQLSREITIKKQKEEAFSQAVRDHEETLSQMYGTIQRLDDAINLSEADYQEIDARLQKSDSKINELKTKQEKELEKFRMLELERSQLELKRDNVANRLEERYQNSYAELKDSYRENEAAHEITAEMTIEQMEADLSHNREKISKIIDVNLGAIKEYEQLNDRFDFLETQREDLLKAIDDLQKVIKKINKITQQKFTETFDKINEKLMVVFPRLFDGGEAKLVLVEPDKPLESGVELMIHPPGKKLTRLSLLSGGEKALSAIAFIFSIFLIKPASFCLLDEIDAPLDDANVFRFNDLLQLIGENSQIIVITHNKRTMEFADMLFGITMEQRGISKVVSVNLIKQEKAA